ncbi:MAG: FAD-dependent oxidoreductase [Acidobacteria bacterium]|nr:FAD-dependent oxidoreductase [Acidobacteriota bacterium]
MRLALACLCSAGLCLAAQQFDVVVYGGAAGGVIAAVSAAREGLKVALLEPRNHLGGMVSGGLSWTDVGKREVIGGYALEFYWRAGSHYEMRRFGQDIAWMHEPKVAENIFRQMLQQAGVAVFEHHRLREKTGVRKNGARLTEITLGNGASFAAALFIDSSYEGDLMAQAGVSCTWGRESVSQYGESLAGVREETPQHQFRVNVSPYGAGGKLLPEVYGGPKGEPGAADKKVQAYNFRMCFSDDPGNRVPFPKPPGYDSKRYELLARLLKARAGQEGKAPALNTLLKIDRIPNRKADINNNGAFSTDFIGGSWDYPDADSRKRDQIWQAHKDYVAGLFYFLAGDPQVPAETQKEMNTWGLCKDEFTDTGHWPHQLYIREARRMVGGFVMTQKDLQTELAKPDPIGMGSYNSDSHNIQRIPTPEGFVRNEGDMQVPVKPYQIPYRIMLPKRGEADNLLVPVAFSASHVAYSSVRMEPQYMILGQAAGVAAKLAIASNKAVQDIDTVALTRTLRGQGAILEYVPSPQAPVMDLFRKKFR